MIKREGFRGTDASDEITSRHLFNSSSHHIRPPHLPPWNPRTHTQFKGIMQGTSRMTFFFFCFYSFELPHRHSFCVWIVPFVLTLIFSAYHFYKPGCSRSNPRLRAEIFYTTYLTYSRYLPRYTGRCNVGTRHSLASGYCGTLA